MTHRDQASPGSGGQDPLRVLMAAGGTGGHVFPALAVAQELQSRQDAKASSGKARRPCQIEFVGAGRAIERRLIPAAGFPLHVVPAAGLKGLGGRRLLHNLLVLPHSFWQTGRLLARFRPHVVVGVGGYVGGPVILLASLAGVPALLIEPNATPGFTNRVLAPFIRMAATGFEDAATVYGAKVRVTGHPVRAAFHHVAPRLHAPPFTILVLGGSQGSVAINRAVTGALPLFAAQAGRYRLVHQTGEADAAQTIEAYRAWRGGIEADVRPFIEDVAEAFEGSDLVICRAGASTVAELAAAGKASLLIPFPGAADNHQLANAKALERVGGARVIEQRDLTPRSLFDEAARLCDRPETLQAMERAAQTLAHPEAAARIADLIEQLAPA